jgi:hypothetical protein
MLLEVLQRARRIFERRPISDGPAVFDAILVRNMDAPLLGEALVDNRQQVPISLCRRIALLAGLVTRMRLEDLLAGGRTRRSLGEAFQRLNHPALPIDQGAVTVEGERVEIREQHVDVSSFLTAACARDKS